MTNGFTYFTTVAAAEAMLVKMTIPAEEKVFYRVETNPAGKIVINVYDEDGFLLGPV